MREFEQKKKVKSRIYSRTSIFILFIVFILLARGVFNIYLKERESRQNRNLAIEKLNNLRERRDMLEKETLRLDTADGIEEEIRKKFPVSKKGEEVIVIVDEKDKEIIPEQKTFWQKVYGVLLFWR